MTLVSDHGNRVNSVKMQVYIYENGGGYVIVKMDSCCLPPNFARKYEFEDTECLAEVIENINDVVREHNFRDKLRFAGFDYVCSHCHGGLRKENTVIIEINGRQVLTCHYCGCPEMSHL